MNRALIWYCGHFSGIITLTHSHSTCPRLATLSYDPGDKPTMLTSMLHIGGGDVVQQLWLSSLTPSWTQVDRQVYKRTVIILWHVKLCSDSEKHEREVNRIWGIVLNSIWFLFVRICDLIRGRTPPPHPPHCTVHFIHYWSNIMKASSFVGWFAPAWLLHHSREINLLKRQPHPRKLYLVRSYIDTLILFSKWQ